MADTLAAMVRRKFPGAYDDISDLDLEAKIDAKHPGAYDDLPRTKNRAKAPDTPSMRAAAREGDKTFTGEAAKGLAEDLLVNAPVGAAKTIGEMVKGGAQVAGYGLRVAAAPLRVPATMAYRAATGDAPHWLINEPIPDGLSVEDALNTPLVKDNPGLAMARGTAQAVNERRQKAEDAAAIGDEREAAAQRLQAGLSVIPGYAQLAKAGERLVGMDAEGGQASALDADPEAGGELLAQLALARGPGKTAQAVENVTKIPVATAARAVGRGAVSAAGKPLAPFAGSVNPEIVAAAERQGVELPASAVSKSKIVPLAESLSAKGPLGGATGARYEKAFGDLTAKADHVVLRASKLTDDVARGEAIAKGLDNYTESWQHTKNALYKEAELPTRMKLFVQAKDTVKFLDEVIAEKQAAGRTLGNAAAVPELKFLKDLRNGLTKGKGLKDVQVRDLAATRKVLNGKIDWKSPVAAGDQAIFKRISATLEDEMDLALKGSDPKLWSKLEAAKATYRDGLAKINSTFGESINKLAGQEKYDLIAKSIANPRMSVADIPRIIEVAGPEGAEAMRASVLADIVRKAKNTEGALTPQGLAKGMKAYGPDRLKALLTPEQMATLSDLSTMSSAMEKGTKVMGGSQSLFLGRWAAYPAAILADPVTALTVLAGDAAASRFIGSKVGQRWLTTGYKPLSAAAPAAARTTSAAARAGQVTQMSRQAPPVAMPSYPRAADREDDGRSRARAALMARYGGM